ncbi:hypothetical protein F5879DRAFT_247616 [Lentinula edodes]|uniref:uncharacterized protein n=1 Tax=Lentinula edodes TaxID=5353 RepID=UPI001E8E092F|nr:uncharacterized protein C8R40DRAFT_1265207 [Lentinula edodes]KAH7875520.1 hypothetical protein C8R40DRAFT_1265207 [Lentinula edodes]KAJ3902393.1 hypothetical protein F5879DRAFT_247616 [Lentinula edodes]KAJ3916912.1 hypothetical protein F5877DRAFT_80450 [Lentinula edodes]
MDNYLPINAISAVILVSGKILSEEENWSGPNIPLVLYRQTPPPANTLDDAYTKGSHHDFSDTYPACPKPPFAIPPPAGLTLHVSLGKLVSEGRTGMIFECECAIPHGNVMGFKIPPVVIKIARQSRTKDISREATAYECMTRIQGCVVPRCYGFFQVRMFEHFDFGPVSVLILEKLGDLFKLGEPLPDGAKSDMKDACSDLAHVRILHGDLRWANMLSVLPGGLPSLASPFTGKTYGWRLVDFDRAERTTLSLPRAQRYYNSYLDRVLDSIPWGNPVEPWD